MMWPRQVIDRDKTMMMNELSVVTRRLSVVLLLCVGLMNAVGANAAEPNYSKLWGQGGERWEVAGRLPDFSYAGYHRGEAELPDAAVGVWARDFGAVGDGVADDTAAIQRAIDAGAGQVVGLDAGRYKISDWLTLGESGTVLRGAGAKLTVLVMNTPLNDIHPNWGSTTSGQRTSNYSWSGGFVRVTGKSPSEPVGDVTAGAKRGARQLMLSNTKGLTVGAMVLLELRDQPNNSLADHLYDGDAGDVENLKGRARATFACRVTAVDAGSGRIDLDRSLRTDVRLAWSPRVYLAEGMLGEIGIEGLGFEYPNTSYGGHFSELGFNAIAISGARDCWVRDIWIHNSDSGLHINGFNHTLQDIVVTSERRPDERLKTTGHHAFTLSGQDILLTRFDLQSRFVHDVTMTRSSAGNVVSQSRGLDLALDHHRFGPHANLFTALDLGAGSRMFKSGGGKALGRHSAAYTTFWGIDAKQNQDWPEGWGPDRMNLVGVKAKEDAAVMETEGRWFEVMGAGGVTPVDLYEAQLARRLSGGVR